MAGKAGAPLGNKNNTHARPWTEALQRVLTQLEVKDENGKVQVKAGEALRKIAESVVKLAMAGDKDAYREIADRLDGRAVQAIVADISFADNYVSLPEPAGSVEEWKEKWLPTLQKSA